MAASAPEFEFRFKPAVLESISLLIGLAGGTGSGKTFSAMRLASGMAPGQRFAVIDTEAGRAKHYAPRKGEKADGRHTFDFDHAELMPPFRPQAYAAAIHAADAAGYKVIVVDSFSHEWAGEGGILDWQEEELDRMAGDNWQKRESCKMAAWIKPKMEHKKMVQRLLQIRAQLILCFRAEEKVEMVREDGKMKIVPKVTRTGLDGWVPIAEKSLPYELTASFLLTADAPGMPKPIKLEEQHRVFFPLDKPIDEVSGAKLAQWASGIDMATVTPAKLIAEYGECQTKQAFEHLEHRRASVWRSIPPSDEKTRLKAASDAAKARLGMTEGAPLTGNGAPGAGNGAKEPPKAEEAIATARGSETLQTLEANRTSVWAAYAAANAEVPNEVHAAFGGREEALKQQQLEL